MTEEHPLSGTLVSGAESASWLQDALQHTRADVSLCSAYLRSEALKRVVDRRREVLTGRVLARWQLRDLLAGASDFAAYPLAKALGLPFWIRLDFHGKVFAVPDRGILVGSANATLSGFGWSADPNAELCTVVRVTDENMSRIDILFDDAVLMTDQLFHRMCDAFERANLTPAVDAVWPEILMEEIQPGRRIKQLLTSECLSEAPRVDGSMVIVSEVDRQLLALSTISVPISVAVLRLQKTRIYRWLAEYLTSNGGEAHFGPLTAALHDVLLDDPRVYRSEVKRYLQILLEWSSTLPQAGIAVDRPRHSQRVRLARK